MEMHQIRYFLALAECLNFTRAAEHCNVAQPSLTRGIKQLEEELGADLFRRENKSTHLTPFGHRMLPFLRQSYEAAKAAKEVASEIRKGGSEPLVIALSKTIDVSLLGAPLAELYRAFPNLEVRFARCDAERLLALLREGGADLAVAADLATDWERLDSWSLFSDGFSCVANAAHPLAAKATIVLDDLRNERIVDRPYCESLRGLRDRATPSGLGKAVSEADCDHDVLRLVEMNLGVAIVPDSWRLTGSLRRVPVEAPDLSREVKLHLVAGRRWSPATSLFVKLLRARDWSALLASGASVRAPGQAAPASPSTAPAA
jgi:DNA-binding transcriptional LysR family regulator